MLSFFFSLDGRIGRLQWWLGPLVPVAIIVALIFFLHNRYGSLDEEAIPPVAHIVLNVLGLVVVWIQFCLTVKRYHDLNKSGLWILMALIPLLWIWMLIECGFFSGTLGPNDYGDRSLGLGQPGLDEEIEALRRQRRREMGGVRPSVTNDFQAVPQPAPKRSKGKTGFGRLGT
ncbi:MAG: DUF805 domain-containing protein [Rhizobiaceae bacterium]